MFSMRLRTADISLCVFSSARWGSGGGGNAWESAHNLQAHNFIHRTLHHILRHKHFSGFAPKRPAGALHPEPLADLWMPGFHDGSAHEGAAAN